MPGGYFSEPSQTLDPELFETGIMRANKHDGHFDVPVLKDDVRTGLLNLLYGDLEAIGFREPWNWAHVWLAGSGITYQWGNGDLDVLFGADFPQFLEDNPQFPRLSMAEVANYTNQIMRSTQWPKTRNVTIGGSKSRYEITFYWNPTTGTSIEGIHPYAAYDLVDDEWTVHPPEVPHDPQTWYPQEWWDEVERDRVDILKARDLHALGRATAIWDNIHGRRNEAFSDTGLGYGDFRNFRWQAAKDNGGVDILRGLVDEADAANALHALPAPADIITRAALRYANPRYTG